MPVTEKTDIFKELSIETLRRNPNKVGLFGYKWGLELGVWRVPFCLGFKGLGFQGKGLGFRV